MTEAPQELRTLVRRDVAVFAAGSVLAVWVAGILVAGHLGLVATRTAATVVVAVGGPLCVGCLWWWASGPRRWLRDRYLVVVPALLAGPSTALALYDLGASVVAVMISSALGFAAAVVLGLAWASRRS